MLVKKEKSMSQQYDVMTKETKDVLGWFKTMLYARQKVIILFFSTLMNPQDIPRLWLCILRKM